MQENRNTSYSQGQGRNAACTNGTVCIDTKRVLDSCRDRDCFEDTRVYLTATGENLLENASNVRTRTAKLLCAYVGVDEVPFNCGFYQVTVRYYIEIEFEACLGVGRSQTFKGIAALEKDVILYGGEGKAISFTSDTSGEYCSPCSYASRGTNDPVAVVETVEPIVLGTKVCDCNCPCPCTCNDYPDLPEGIRDSLGEEIVTNSNGAKIYVSFGIFSVIRIVRPAQFLIQATDYTVPDKECTAATNDDSPCALFRTVPFPVSQFKGMDCTSGEVRTTNNGCGCGK